MFYGYDIWNLNLVFHKLSIIRVSQITTCFRESTIASICAVLTNCSSVMVRSHRLKNQRQESLCLRPSVSLRFVCFGRVTL